MDRDSIITDLNFALRHKLVPPIRWKREHESRAAAKAILEHLELCGYRFTRRLPIPVTPSKHTEPQSQVATEARRCDKSK